MRREPNRVVASVLTGFDASLLRGRCAVLVVLTVHVLIALSLTSHVALAVDAQLAKRPLVIAHRGASGERPEHTLAAYRLAIEQGADFIEPDLVVTRDGVLIARHENELSGTTDVASHPEFAYRQASKRIDGEAISGWFSEDFTLAEIRQLRARERLPQLRPDNVRYDGQEAIPTLAEILALVREFEQVGRKVGIYPETKHPTWFASEGAHLDGTPIRRSLGAMLVDQLVAERFTDPHRVFIQSFELGNLLELATAIMPDAGVDLPLLLLLGELRAMPPHGAFSQPYDIGYVHRRADVGPRSRYAGLSEALGRPLDRSVGYADLATPSALRWLKSSGVHGVGPWKDALLPRVPMATTVESGTPPCRLTGLVHPLISDARAAGLAVHPYTLRREPAFLCLDEHGERMNMEQELRRLLAAGATGFFTDHASLGVQARDAWWAENR